MFDAAADCGADSCGGFARTTGLESDVAVAPAVEAHEDRQRSDWQQPPDGG